MTKTEFIELRIAELEARERYAGQMVMNRELDHEAKMCRKQIEALNEIMLADEMAAVLPTENPLEEIGPFVQYWTQGSNPQQLIHTDDSGHDTVLCENHLTDNMVACSNCIQPWPVFNRA